MYWDAVISIEPDGVEAVYDLTVEGLHNFVADDLVAHNSIEQDADVVMFVYRDEYYDKESERLGEGLYSTVRKHRNGPIGQVGPHLPAEVPQVRQPLQGPRLWASTVGPWTEPPDVQHRVA